MRHIATNAGGEGSIVVTKVKALEQDEGFNAATETCEHRRHVLGGRPGSATTDSKGAVMGDKGGKKNKVKNQKQHDQKAKDKEQRPVEKAVATPLLRQAQPASRA